MVTITPLEEVGTVGYETAEWHQTLQSLRGSYANSIFDNVPRRCRSKRKSNSTKTAKAVDSGKGKIVITQKHRSKLRFSADIYGPRKKRSKSIADSSNAEVNVHRFRVRGQLRGRLNSCKQGKLDSKTFEDYMEHIWSTFSEESRNSFTYLDSLWFSLYSQKYSKEKVMNWVKRKDIFSKKYVFVPIVMWSHWSLLILCHFGETIQSESRTPSILLLDSLWTANPKRLEPGIRKFILDVYNVNQRPGNKESIRKIPLLVPKVPQQRNGVECGNFVLYYISLFLKNAPENFSISEGYPYFMKEDWFTLEELDNFCKRLELDSNTKNSLSLDK